MVKFDGPEMNDQIPPDLVYREQRIVLVTHDESCFSSNDGRATIWFDEDHRPLRPKGEGRWLMVSEFMCECHGPLKLTAELQTMHPNEPCESLEIIAPGKNADGYWTNKDLVNQIRTKAIPIFKLLHPNCIALFIFDNSQNHHALPPDALRASALNLSDGGKNVRPQRNGWFVKDGERMPQAMQRIDGVQKGVRSILQERGLWAPTLSLQAARKLLSEQPDFREQKEWLHEVVNENNFIIDYYPKFHCEFNFIEMYWGATKNTLDAIVTTLLKDCSRSFDQPLRLYR